MSEEDKAKWLLNCTFDTPNRAVCAVMVQNQYKCDAVLRVNKNVPIVEPNYTDFYLKSTAHVVPTDIWTW